MQKTSIGSRFILELIHFYQGLKLTGLIPVACRFIPSCSDYADQAICQHGLFKGIRLSAARFLRCQPGHQGGYDPVN